MEQPTIEAKITAFVKAELLDKQKTFIEQLAKGGLYGFEENLTEILQGFFNLISEELLAASAQAAEPVLRAIAKRKRMGKLVKRPMTIQLKTGHYASVEGLYAKTVPAQHLGSRHLLSLHWGLLKGASPGYYGAICLFSVLCPSFEVAGQILDIQGVAYNRVRVQELANCFAHQCKPRQALLARAPGESLKGLRVIIGIDGGRTRMREYDGKTNERGNATFDTPWREPKMFVIDVMDDEGNIERTCLPIYGCVFGDDELVDLLASHLKGLDISQAKQVQVAADGAPWIWNRISPMLISLGVDKEKIVELVDYFHAAQYVHKIVQGLPKKFASQSAKILKEFKERLWQGNIQPIVEKCRKMFAKPGKEINQYIGYLSKNDKSMQYADYRANKLMCGSGIIESGIRRVINLRFKNSSAFWKQANVECMYFLRGILLSYRWKIMMNNFVTA
jgi:hypothetical protein